MFLWPVRQNRFKEHFSLLMSPADGGLRREQDISGTAGDPSAVQCGQTYFPSSRPD